MKQERYYKINKKRVQDCLDAKGSSVSLVDPSNLSMLRLTNSKRKISITVSKSDS